MTVLVAILAIALAALGACFAARERGRRSLPTASPTRVLFPFTGTVLSQRGLDAALRLTRVDGATLVPVFLAQVPLHLPLDAALPRQCDSALPLLEAIEQQAARAGVAVDARIERGRSLRHAIRELVAHETVDTVVVTAGDEGSPGLLPDDIGWLLEHVPGEIIVIRPGLADLQLIPTPQESVRQRVRQSRPSRAPGTRRGARRPRPRLRASDGRGGRT
jgi:nucleotide-binding universal stress UspA family protein